VTNERFTPRGGGARRESEEACQQAEERAITRQRHDHGVIEILKTIIIFKSFEFNYKNHKNKNIQKEEEICLRKRLYL
jgi:hypothetical protein